MILLEKINTGEMKATSKNTVLYPFGKITVWAF